MNNEKLVNKANQKSKRIKTYMDIDLLNNFYVVKVDLTKYFFKNKFNELKGKDVKSKLFRLEELSSSVNIYPNPVNDMLYIKTDFEIEDVVVYDVFGRQQDNRTTRQQDNVTIDVSKLDAGVYFVKIKTAEGEIVKRIVKRN